MAIEIERVLVSLPRVPTSAVYSSEVSMGSSSHESRPFPNVTGVWRVLDAAPAAGTWRRNFARARFFSLAISMRLACMHRQAQAGSTGLGVGKVGVHLGNLISATRAKATLDFLGSGQRGTNLVGVTKLQVAVLDDGISRRDEVTNAVVCRVDLRADELVSPAPALSWDLSWVERRETGEEDRHGERCRPASRRVGLLVRVAMRAARHGCCALMRNVRGHTVCNGHVATLRIPRRRRDAGAVRLPKVSDDVTFEKFHFTKSWTYGIRKMRNVLCCFWSTVGGVVCHNCDTSCVKSVSRNHFVLFVICS